MFHTLNIGDSLSTSNGGTFTLRGINTDSVLVELKLHPPKGPPPVNRTISVDQTKRQCPDCQTPQWIDDDESTCLCCRRARQHDA